MNSRIPEGAAGTRSPGERGRCNPGAVFLAISAVLAGCAGPREWKDSCGQIHVLWHQYLIQKNDFKSERNILFPIIYFKNHSGQALSLQETRCELLSASGSIPIQDISFEFKNRFLNPSAMDDRGDNRITGDWSCCLQEDEKRFVGIRLALPRDAKIELRSMIRLKLAFRWKEALETITVSPPLKYFPE